MTTTSARTIMVGVMLLGVLALAPLGVTAACTPLADATPAASSTFIVQSGECAGDINIVNNGVKIVIQPGADPFQAGKNIVLPASGVIANFELDVTAVVWVVSQQLFSGGSASLFEFQGAVIEFKDSSIASTKADPIGFDGKLTTSSQYTVSATTVTVTTTSGSTYGVYLTGAISGSSTVTVSSSTIIVSTTSGSSSIYGVRLSGSITGSSSVLLQQSKITSETSGSGYAYGVYLAGAITDSTASGDDSTFSSVNTGTGYSYGVRFGGTITRSTVSLNFAKVNTVGSGSLSAHVVRFTTINDASTVSLDSAILTGTNPDEISGVYGSGTITDSSVSLKHLTAIISSGNEVYGVNFAGNPTNSHLSLDHSQITATSSGATTSDDAYGVKFYTLSSCTVSLDHATLIAASTGGGDVRVARFSGISASSSVSISNTTVIATATGATAYGAYFYGSVGDSSVVLHSSRLRATSTSYSFAVRFYTSITGSLISLSHSTITASSVTRYAYGVRTTTIAGSTVSLNHTVVSVSTPAGGEYVYAVRFSDISSSTKVSLAYASVSSATHGVWSYAVYFADTAAGCSISADHSTISAVNTGTGGNLYGVGFGLITSATVSMVSSSIATTQAGDGVSCGVRFAAATTAGSTVSLNHITISATAVGTTNTDDYTYGVWYDATTVDNSAISIDHSSISAATTGTKDCFGLYFPTTTGGTTISVDYTKVVSTVIGTGEGRGVDFPALTDTTVSLDHSFIQAQGDDFAFGIKFHALTTATVSMQSTGISAFCKGAGGSYGVYTEAVSGLNLIVHYANISSTGALGGLVYGVIFSGTVTTNSNLALDSTQISCTGETGNAYAVRLDQGLTISTLSMNHATLKAESASSSAYGLRVEPGFTIASSTISLTNATISGTTTVSSNAYGVALYSASTTSTVTMDYSQISLTGAASAYGVYFTVATTTSTVSLKHTAISCTGTDLVYGVRFGATTIDSTVSLESALIIAVASGIGDGYGVRFADISSSSTATLTRATIRTSNSGTGVAYGTYVSGSPTDSTVSLDWATVSATNTGTGFAYAVRFYTTTATSTLSLDHATITASSVGSYVGGVRTSTIVGSTVSLNHTVVSASTPAGGDYVYAVRFSDMSSSAKVSLAYASVSSATHGVLSYAVYFADAAAGCSISADHSTISAVNTGTGGNLYGVRVGLITSATVSMASSSIAATHTGDGGKATGIWFVSPTTAGSTVSLNHITISATAGGSSGYSYGVWYDATNADNSAISIDHSSISVATTGTKDCYGVYFPTTTGGTSLLLKHTNIVAAVTGTGEGWGVILPDATTSTLSVEHSTILGHGDNYAYGIKFSTLTTSSVSLAHSTISASCASGGGEAYGVYCATTLTSTMSLRYANVTSTASGSGGAKGMIFYTATADSTISLDHSRVVTLASGTGTVHGIYLSNTATSIIRLSASLVSSTGAGGSVYGVYATSTLGSTLPFDNSIITASSNGGGTAYGMLFLVSSLATRIDLHGVVVTSTHSSLLVSNAILGTVFLRQSHFTGPSDLSAGPLDAAIIATASGKINVTCSYWNSVTRSMRPSFSLLPHYATSASLRTTIVSCDTETESQSSTATVSPPPTGTATTTITPPRPLTASRTVSVSPPPTGSHTPTRTPAATSTKTTTGTETPPRSSTSTQLPMIPPTIVAPSGSQSEHTGSSLASSIITSSSSSSSSGTGSGSSLTTTSQLAVTATHVAHWTAQFVLSVPSVRRRTAGDLHNVYLEVSVMAAVILSVEGNSSLCSQAASTTSTVACRMPLLPAGTSVTFFAFVNSSLSYRFNGAVQLRYKATAQETTTSDVTGTLTLLPDTFSNGNSSNQATPSPGGGSSPASGNSRRGVFGQGDGLGRCIDAWVFTTFASVVLVLVVGFLVVPIMFSRASGKKEAEDAEKNPIKLPVNTWQGIRLWRSLVLQHAYCVVPCHDQCHLAHTLPLVAHVFTLMMLCAVISALLGSDISGVTITAVVSTFLAAGLRPVLVNVFYFRFTWPQEPVYKREQTQEGNNTTQATMNSSSLIPPGKEAGHKDPLGGTGKSTMGGTGGSTLGGSTPGSTTLGSSITRTPSQIPWNKNTSFTRTPQIEASMVALDQLKLEPEDDVVKLEKSVDDDLDLNADFDDAVEMTPTAGAAGAGETIMRLGAEVEATNEEQEGDIDFDAEAFPPRTAPLVTVVDGGTPPAEPSSEAEEWTKVTVAPHRKKGHYLVGVAGAIVSMLALLQLLNIQSSTSCHIFEEAFQYAVLGDFCIVQPFTVAMTYLYRWLTSEDDDADTDVWSELHPYDGEERPM